MNIDLTAYASEQQRRFDASTSSEERKQQGHFGTPPAIAHFMAGQFSRRKPDQTPERQAPESSRGVEQPRVLRVLDPGAGVGTLSAAVCQRVLADRFLGPYPRRGG